jgi:hypothetical protein
MRKKEATILIVDDDEDIFFGESLVEKFFEEVITINSPKKIIPLLMKIMLMSFFWI